MTHIYMAWIKSLRPPPRDAATYQVMYSLIAALGCVTIFAQHGPNWWDHAVYAATAIMCISGGLVGALAQHAGFVRFERGALWMMLGGLLSSSALNISMGIVSPGITDAEVAVRVVTILALCVALLLRFWRLPHTDLDPYPSSRVRRLQRRVLCRRER